MKTAWLAVEFREYRYIFFCVFSLLLLLLWFAIMTTLSHPFIRNSDPIEVPNEHAAVVDEVYDW